MHWLRHSFRLLIDWIPSLGVFGPLVLVLVDAIVCLIFLPGSAVTLAAGFLYGTAAGALIASAGSTLGAAAAFLISRFLVRTWIESRMATHPTFIALDRAIGREGFKIVLLCRLCSLIPFDVTSYVSGITKVSFRKYIFATFLGRLPETLMFAYLGTTVKSIHDLVRGNVEFGLAQRVFTVLGLIATVAVTVFVGHLARRALHEATNGYRRQTGEPDA